MSARTEGLSGVASGLAAMYYGLLLIVATYLFGAATPGFAPQVIQAVGGPMNYLYIVGGLLIAGYVFYVAGQVKCLSISSSSDAGTYIYLSVVLMLLSLGITVAGFFMAVPKELTYAQIGMNLLSFALFLIFEKSVAMMIGRPDLASKASRVMAYSIVVGVAGTAMGAYTYANVDPKADPEAFRQNAGTFAIVFLVLGLFALITFIMYANLLLFLSRAIRSHLGDAEVE